MPLETDLLEKLGLRDIPRWYRDKFGVDSLVNHGLQHRTSSRLAITDQSQPSNPALHSPSSNSFEFKSSAPQPKQRSPPRAAHNHGTNGGVSQVRVSRSNAGWKGRQTRRQSVTASPSHTDPNASFHASLYDNAATPSSLSGYTAFLQTGAFGSGMATVATAAPSVSSLAGNNNTNLKDSGSPHRTSTVTGESLTMAKDPFVDGFAVTANDIDKAHLKSKSRRAFEQHKAKDSSSVDGGVKLPVDSFYQYGSFSALANMDDAATNAIPGTESSSLSNQLDRSASKSPLSDIVSESDPLEEDDVRDAWGPVGSPVALTAAHAAANPPVVLVDRNLQYQHQRSPTVIRAFHPYAKSPHAN